MCNFVLIDEDTIKDISIIKCILTFLTSIILPIAKLAPFKNKNLLNLGYILKSNCTAQNTLFSCTIELCGVKIWDNVEKLYASLNTYPFNGLHGRRATPSLAHTSVTSHSEVRTSKLYCCYNQTQKANHLIIFSFNSPRFRHFATCNRPILGFMMTYRSWCLNIIIFFVKFFTITSHHFVERLVLSVSDFS